MTVKYKLFDNKLIHYAILLWSCIFIICISSISIYGVIKMEKLENELEMTKKIVNDLEKYFDFIKDFSDYEFGSIDNNNNDYDNFKDDDEHEYWNDNIEYFDDLEDEDNDDDVYNDNNDLDENIETTTKSKNINNNMLVKIGRVRSRTKRDILAATRDGVLIKSESYAEFKRRNRTRSQELNSNAGKTTLKLYDELERRTTPKPRPIMNRKSRVMKTDDKTKTRHIIKKPMVRSLDNIENLDRRQKYYRHKRDSSFVLPIIKYHYSRQDQSSGQEMTIVRDVIPVRRRHRQRLEMLDENPLRLSKLRPQPAIHFSGDTSKYVLGQHHNFKGNGHLKHRSKTFVDWEPENWVKSLGMDQHFVMRDGTVTIKEPGLYFVYSQIYYLDEHDTNGYHVYKNNDIVLQCTTMTHSSERVMKGNTCYTGGAVYLSEGDKIELRDISDSRYSLFEPGKSFFGIIKLGEIKMK